MQLWGQEQNIVQARTLLAVSWEVSAELLTLVPAKNKGGREKPDYKVAIIKPFISVLRNDENKGNCMYCALKKNQQPDFEMKGNLQKTLPLQLFGE